MQLGRDNLVDSVGCIRPHELDGIPYKRYGDPEGDNTDRDAEI